MTYHAANSLILLPCTTCWPLYIKPGSALAYLLNFLLSGTFPYLNYRRTHTRFPSTKNRGLHLNLSGLNLAEVPAHKGIQNPTLVARGLTASHPRPLFLPGCPSFDEIRRYPGVTETARLGLFTSANKADESLAAPVIILLAVGTRIILCQGCTNSRVPCGLDGTSPTRLD